MLENYTDHKAIINGEIMSFDWSSNFRNAHPECDYLGKGKLYSLKINGEYKILNSEEERHFFKKKEDVNLTIKTTLNKIHLEFYLKNEKPIAFFNLTPKKLFKILKSYYRK